MSEQERDDERDNRAGANRDEPPAEVPGQILDPTHDKGAKMAGEIANGVDGGDARHSGRLARPARRAIDEPGPFTSCYGGSVGGRRSIERRSGQKLGR